MKNVFLSIGGNIGDTKKVIFQAFEKLANKKRISLIKTSHIYKTSPVSPIKQRFFLNAACHLKTILSPFSLLKELQQIEKNLGKIKKIKAAPRVIDIDIIFYESFYLHTKNLTLPHPCWKERLFVLQPLSDLQNLFWVPKKDRCYLFNIQKFLKTFKNFEQVVILQKNPDLL